MQFEYLDGSYFLWSGVEQAQLRRLLRASPVGSHIPAFPIPGTSRGRCRKSFQIFSSGAGEGRVGHSSVRPLLITNRN